MTAPRVSVDEAAFAWLLECTDGAATWCDTPKPSNGEGRCCNYYGDGDERNGDCDGCRLWRALAALDARPIPPALAAADAAALVDDLVDCAAPYDDRSGWRDKDHAALDAARADVIAALTGRATDAALAEAEARGRAAALAEVDAAIEALAEHDEFETVTIWRVYTPCGWLAEAAPKIGGTLRLEGPTPTAAIIAAAAALAGQGGAS